LSISTLSDDISGQEVTVLFSGGRDSTLTVCFLILKGAKVHLLTGNSGLGIGSDSVETRYRELFGKFGNKIVTWKTVDTRGLLRAIAFKNIEEDFKQYRYNLILLGEKTALHTEAIVYSLASGIKYIADGTAQYQKHLSEQMPESISFFTNLSEDYGIKYITPILGAENEEQVKEQLFLLGLSTKSLESVSLFSDSFTAPAEGISALYLSKKKWICTRYISFRQGHFSGFESLTSSEGISNKS